MPRGDFVRPHGSGCTVEIDASPGAKRTEIVGVNSWRMALQIKIAAAAQEGAANDELIRFLSERFSIPRRGIVIVKGERSAHKTILLPIDAERARVILAGD